MTRLNNNRECKLSADIAKEKPLAAGNLQPSKVGTNANESGGFVFIPEVSVNNEEEDSWVECVPSDRDPIIEIERAIAGLGSNPSIALIQSITNMYLSAVEFHPSRTQELLAHMNTFLELPHVRCALLRISAGEDECLK